MPIHKLLIQERLERAEHAYTEAANEATRLNGQVRAERKAIDELTDQYNTACRRLATGADGVEPATILSERDRRSHRLRGLESLLKEQQASLLPLQDEHQAAQSAMQAELDREEMERMETAIATTRQTFEDATAALKDADQQHRSAVWARHQFQQKLDLRAKQRA